MSEIEGDVEHNCIECLITCDCDAEHEDDCNMCSDCREESFTPMYGEDGDEMDFDDYLHDYF